MGKHEMSGFVRDRIAQNQPFPSLLAHVGHVASQVHGLLRCSFCKYISAAGADAVVADRETCYPIIEVAEPEGSRIGNEQDGQLQDVSASQERNSVVVDAFDMFFGFEKDIGRNLRKIQNAKNQCRLGINGITEGRLADYRRGEHPNHDPTEIAP
jgi:hypothetical protein